MSSIAQKDGLRDLLGVLRQDARKCRFVFEVLRFQDRDAGLG